MTRPKCIDCYYCYNKKIEAIAHAFCCYYPPSVKVGYYPKIIDADAFCSRFKHRLDGEAHFKSYMETIDFLSAEKPSQMEIKVTSCEKCLLCNVSDGNPCSPHDWCRLSNKEIKESPRPDWCELPVLITAYS